jgi:hypothetical protein
VASSATVARAAIASPSARSRIAGLVAFIGPH